MKTLKLKIFAILAILTITLGSCSDDLPAPLGIQNPADSNLIAQMKAIPDLSSLLAALQKTGLTETFNGSTQYTVYAPTNLAFSTFLTSNGYASLEVVPTADLKNILLNHVINGRIAIDAIDNGYYTSLAKYPGTSISAIIISSRSRVNSISVVTSRRNINASNGILHVVSAVVPFGTVANLIAGNANLTQLNDFVIATGADAQPDVVAALTATTNKTVFAPTNAAFDEALNDDLEKGPIGFLDGNTNQANVNSLLKYHVVDGNRQSPTLMNNDVINTFLTLPTQKTIKITKDGSGVKVTDTDNKVAKVTISDVQASDGTIHIIDTVLNPFL